MIHFPRTLDAMAGSAALPKPIRVGLVFAEDLVTPQMLQSGLERCWHQADAGAGSIQQFCSQIQVAFELHSVPPGQLRLSLDGLTLPPSSSTSLLRDGDVLHVSLPPLALPGSSPAGQFVIRKRRRRVHSNGSLINTPQQQQQLVGEAEAGAAPLLLAARGPSRLAGTLSPGLTGPLTSPVGSAGPTALARNNMFLEGAVWLEDGVISPVPPQGPAAAAQQGAGLPSPSTHPSSIMARAPSELYRTPSNPVPSQLQLAPMSAPATLSIPAVTPAPQPPLSLMQATKPLPVVHTRGDMEAEVGHTGLNQGAHIPNVSSAFTPASEPLAAHAATNTALSPALHTAHTAGPNTALHAAHNAAIDSSYNPALNLSPALKTDLDGVPGFRMDFHPSSVAPGEPATGISSARWQQPRQKRAANEQDMHEGLDAQHVAKKQAQSCSKPMQKTDAKIKNVAGTNTDRVRTGLKHAEAEHAGRGHRVPGSPAARPLDALGQPNGTGLPNGVRNGVVSEGQTHERHSSRRPVSDSQVTERQASERQVHKSAAQNGVHTAAAAGSSSKPPAPRRPAAQNTLANNAVDALKQCRRVQPDTLASKSMDEQTQLSLTQQDPLGNNTGNGQKQTRPAPQGVASSNASMKLHAAIGKDSRHQPGLPLHALQPPPRPSVSRPADPTLAAKGPAAPGGGGSGPSAGAPTKGGIPLRREEVHGAQLQKPIGIKEREGAARGPAARGEVPGVAAAGGPGTGIGNVHCNTHALVSTAAYSLVPGIGHRASHGATALHCTGEQVVSHDGSSSQEGNTGAGHHKGGPVEKGHHLGEPSPDANGMRRLMAAQTSSVTRPCVATTATALASSVAAMKSRAATVAAQATITGAGAAEMVQTTATAAATNAADANAAAAITLKAGAAMAATAKATEVAAGGTPAATAPAAVRVAAAAGGSTGSQATRGNGSGHSLMPGIQGSTLEGQQVGSAQCEGAAGPQAAVAAGSTPAGAKTPSRNARRKAAKRRLKRLGVVQPLKKPVPQPKPQPAQGPFRWPKAKGTGREGPTEQKKPGHWHFSEYSGDETAGDQIAGGREEREPAQHYRPSTSYSATPNPNLATPHAAKPEPASTQVPSSGSAGLKNQKSGLRVPAGEAGESREGEDDESQESSEESSEESKESRGGSEKGEVGERGQGTAAKGERLDQESNSGESEGSESSSESSDCSEDKEIKVHMEGREDQSSSQERGKESSLAESESSSEDSEKGSEKEISSEKSSEDDKSSTEESGEESDSSSEESSGGKESESVSQASGEDGECSSEESSEEEGAEGTQHATAEMISGRGTGSGTNGTDGANGTTGVNGTTAVNRGNDVSGASSRDSSSSDESSEESSDDESAGGRETKASGGAVHRTPQASRRGLPSTAAQDSPQPPSAPAMCSDPRSAMRGNAPSGRGNAPAGAPDSLAGPSPLTPPGQPSALGNGWLPLPPSRSAGGASGHTGDAGGVAGVQAKVGGKGRGETEERGVRGTGPRAAGGLPDLASLPPLAAADVCEQQVVGYQLLEIGLDMCPRVSEWRTARVTRLHAGTLTLTAWPDPTVHPLQPLLDQLCAQAEKEGEEDLEDIQLPFDSPYDMHGVLTCTTDSFCKLCLVHDAPVGKKMTARGADARAASPGITAGSIPAGKPASTPGGTPACKPASTLSGTPAYRPASTPSSTAGISTRAVLGTTRGAKAGGRKERGVIGPGVGTVGAGEARYQRGEQGVQAQRQDVAWTSGSARGSASSLMADACGKIIQESPHALPNTPASGEQGPLSNSNKRAIPITPLGWGELAEQLRQRTAELEHQAEYTTTQHSAPTLAGGKQGQQATGSGDTSHRGRPGARRTAIGPLLSHLRASGALDS